MNTRYLVTLIMLCSFMGAQSNVAATKAEITKKSHATHEIIRQNTNRGTT